MLANTPKDYSMYDSLYRDKKDELNERKIMRQGYAVAQLVEALRYKPEGRGFDSRWSHWNFSVT